MLENGKIEGNGKLLTNNTKVILSLDTYDGNYTLTNITITGEKTNNGNLTLNNCTLDGKRDVTLIQNWGNLTLNNCTIDCTIRGGTLIIGDDCVFENNTRLSGNIITNRTDIISYLSSFNGNYTLNNMTFIATGNSGNLTVINSVISNGMRNSGNLIYINCTISGLYDGNNYGGTFVYGLISNSGNLTFINCSITNCSAKMNNNVFIIRNTGNLSIINTTIHDNNNNISIITDGNSNNIGSKGCNFYIVNSTLSSSFHNDIIMDTSDNHNDIKYDMHVNNYNANVTLVNSTFTGGDRGVIIERGNSVLVDNCTFNGKYLNITGGLGTGYYYGVALLVNVKSALVNNSVFENNVLNMNHFWIYNGGATIASSGFTDNITVVNSVFRNNTLSGRLSVGGPRGNDPNSATGQIFLYYSVIFIL